MKQIVYVTPGVEIKRLTPKDRRMFSNINPLNSYIVLRCQPLSIAILQDQRKKICNFCLSQTELQRCKQCHTYYYCSKECQASDWKQYHKKECQLLSTFNKNSGHIPGNILILVRLYMNDIKLDDLCGDLEKLQESQKLQYNEIAIMIVSNQIKLNNSSLGDELNLNAIQQLMIIQAKIQMNAFTIVETISGQELGIGIYEPANFFDHRCSYVQEMGNLNSDCANCQVAFQGKELFIFTNDVYKEQVKQQKTRNIELTISYNNGEKRKVFLQSQYGFICTCSRCIYEQQIHEPGQVFKMEVKQNSVMEINQLQSLGQKFHETQTLECYNELMVHVDSLQDERFYQAIESLYLQILDKKEFKLAFRILKRLIKGMPLWLTSEFHPYIGWKLNEASKLAFHLNYLTVGEELSKQAISQLRMFYRDFEKIQDFQDLMIRLTDIQKEIKMNK